jgi:integrase/recombinase XerD
MSRPAITEAVRARLHPLMADYTDHLILRGRLRSTATVAEALVQFHRWAQERAIDPVAATADQLAAFQGYLVSEHRTPQGEPLARITAASRVHHLKAWYRWLTNRGHLVADPARDLGVRIVVSRQVRKEHLNLQEATALVQTAASIAAKLRPGTSRHAQALRNLAAVALTLATGRRISGITGLTTAQVDLDRRELRVDREKGRTGRVLPVAAWAMDTVRAYLAEGRPLLTRGHDAPWVFLGLGGEEPIRPLALGVMLRKLVAATITQNPDLTELPGRHLSWHSLRVSFATLLFANGCDIRSVNELMLHRRLSTTAAYTPIPVEDLRQVFRTAHPRA